MTRQRTPNGAIEQTAMGFTLAPVWNPASLIGGGLARGKIKQVWSKAHDGNQTIVCTVALDYGLPPLKYVPIARGFLNLMNGEAWTPEVDDWVLVAFLHGSIDQPLIVGWLAPPLSEGTNQIERDENPMEQKTYHWALKNKRQQGETTTDKKEIHDRLQDKDDNWLEGFPQDERITIEKDRAHAIKGKFYLKVGGKLYIEADEVEWKVGKTITTKAKSSTRDFQEFDRTRAPKIYHSGGTSETRKTITPATANETDKTIQINPDGAAYEDITPPEGFPGNNTPATVPAGNGTDQAVLDAATSQTGTPYGTGGSAPGSFDCSGLASWSGVKGGAFPQGTRDTANGLFNRMNQVVPAGQEQPGDFVFFGSPGSIGHVGIVSDPSTRTMIAAPRPGRNVGPSSYNRSSVAGFRRPSGGIT